MSNDALRARSLLLLLTEMKLQARNFIKQKVLGILRGAFEKNANFSGKTKKKNILLRLFNKDVQL